MMTWWWMRWVLAGLLLLAVTGSIAEEEELSDPVQYVEKALKEETGKTPAPEQVVDALNGWVVAVYQDGEYQIGLEIARQTLDYAEKKLGPEHPATLASVHNLAKLYEAQVRYGDAEPLYQRALAAWEKILGPEHPDTLTSVNNLAELYQGQGRYGDAEPLYQRALVAREKVLGPEHPDTLRSVRNLAGLYQAQGRYGDTEPLYQRALTGFEKTLGPEHPATLTSVHNLASLYKAQARYGDAEPLYQRALAAWEKILGPEHPATLTSVNNLAGLYQAQGRYKDAEPLYQRALAGAEKALGPEHPDTLRSVNNLAGLYQAQGRYKDAEQLYQRALTSFEKVLGPEHLATLTSVHNLAALYRFQGRYGEAEPLYQRALAGAEKALGPKHPDTLTSVHNLAELYQAQGRYGEAEPLYQRALAGAEKALGPEHPDTLGSVDNLAGLYQAQGRYGDAEPLYQRVLAAREKALGPEHPATLTSVHNLAVLYDVQGRYGDAEQLLQRALAGAEKALGPEHPATLTSVHNLAVLYDVQGRYGDAEPLLQRALAVREKVLGPKHPDALTAQLNYVVVLVNQKQPQRALRELKRLEPRLLEFATGQIHTTLKERVRRQFLWRHSNFQDGVLTLALEHPTPEALQFAADVLLRWKRVQEEEEALLAHLLRTSGDPAIQSLGRDLAALRSELSHLANLPEPDPKLLQTRYQTLEAKEQALAQINPDFKQHLAVRGADADTVRAHLPRGSALLELRQYRPADFKTGKLGAPHWLALLLPAEADTGQNLYLEDLGPVAESQRLREELRQSGKLETAAQLYRTLFGKLEDRLKKFDPLYLAPDGFLNLVAFSSLVLPDGRYWIERQTLRQIQTGRNLIPEASLPSPKGFLALGDVDYQSDAMQVPDQPLDNQTRALNRQVEEQLGPFEAFSSSGPQVKEIASYWDYLVGEARQVWLAQEASEARLKALNTAPRVLHLATHGFYLEPKPGQFPVDPQERPMVLSGLALAGANQGLKGKLSTSGDDGILYALEVQGLNLEGTELVSLSACDTGQGSPDYSEGVYGLVRAFRIAGVRNILMTLWTIQDTYAKEFMTRFYREWLSTGLGDPALSLRKTQLAFIRDEYPELRDPQVWAPFVLVKTRH